MQEIPAAGERSRFKVNGADLLVETWGDGDHLVCLHGGMGVDSSYLKVPGIMGLAGSRRRLLIYDQRGHGGSARTGPATYTHATWLEDLRLLARGLKIARFALLGHSYGGFLALEFALRHPAMVSHLILVGTSAGPVHPGPAPPMVDDAGLARFYRNQWPRFFAGERIFPEVLDRMDFSLEAFRSAFERELPTYDLRERVQDLKLPVLLVAGDRDHYASDMRRLHGRIAGSELAIIPQAGHFPFLEKPDLFGELVAGFLGRGPC